MAVKWPEGFVSAGLACGIKGGQVLDLGLLASATGPVQWAGTFTRNAAAAAPVLWSKARLGSPVRALVVNSGNANACTGAAGERAAEATAERAAEVLGCSSDEVLVASTGPIGIELPVDKLLAGLPVLSAELGADCDAFATSIMTTDTVPKLAHAQVGDAAIVGVAKGAAMLAPNMATMLAFVATDAQVDDLQSFLSGAVRLSFDRISTDACESTNDSVFLLSSGAAGPVDPDDFSKALGEVCQSLAEQMVRDAEGGSKLVRVGVSGAASGEQAADLGRAVAASALWRAALHGSDPNWGRVVSALGSCDRSLDLSAVSVDIGDVRVFAAGEPTGELGAAAGEMNGDEVLVRCVVGTGPGEAEILTTDLSPDYVTLNATGTS
jgi:glutamate N-acetyltransferase / amino-acid N-acetyltransferase